MTRITRGQSRAYVLISVLICLTLVMALGTAWLRMTGLERAHLRADLRAHRPSCWRPPDCRAPRPAWRLTATISAKPGALTARSQTRSAAR